MHTKNWKQAGVKPGPGIKVLVMIHGRGAGADDILSIAEHLNVNDFSLIAPEATNNTWYPYSFLAPPKQNEPFLSSALANLKELTDELNKKGIRDEDIYFLGFSQGACLTLEYTTRNAKRYGGIVAFTGGLIGDQIYYENYSGDFGGTPVFIGTSDPDPHVPVARAAASAELVKSMGADVIFKIYPGMGHTISGDEIRIANEKIFGAR
ncbi:alpha/beta hydrolase [Pollutibacter soli]|uniref:alpha/beta hydrolase n=1 Tax=Pollutibacter soli TaxID=3034157 RepID=UPI003013B2B5